MGANGGSVTGVRARVCVCANARVTKAKHRGEMRVSVRAPTSKSL